MRQHAYQRTCHSLYRHDAEISNQVKHVAPKASGVFYATPAEIPKSQQFGVSLTWCVLHVIDSGASIGAQKSARGGGGALLACVREVG